MTLQANEAPAPAVEAYGEVLRLQPENDVARYLSSHALRNSGDLGAASVQLASCFDSGIQYSPAFRTAAAWALEDGDLDRALRMATEASKRWPDAPGIRAVKARVELASGDYAAAVETLSTGVETLESGDYEEYLSARAKQITLGEGPAVEPVAEPNWPDPWLEELRRYRGGTAASLRDAQAALAAGEPLQAIEILEPVRRWEPDDPRVPQLLGVAYREAGNPEESLAILEEALGRQPEVFETRFQALTTRFLIAMESGSDDLRRTAAREAERLRTDWPDDWRSHALAGDVLHGTGQSVRALEAYLRCSSLKERSEARCEYKAARSLLLLDRAREANELLLETFGDKPQAPEVARLLAQTRASLSGAE
jgi:predicted Zn-dependent protease